VRFVLRAGDLDGGGEPCSGALRRLAVDFAGPALLARGDRRCFCVDRPFGAGQESSPDLPRSAGPGAPPAGRARIGADLGRAGVFDVTSGGRECAPR
jgi:hypothetical protein